MKILITGGAGYKGVKLASSLLALKYNVAVLDNFMYGYEPVLPLVRERRCSIYQKDIRSLTKDDVKDYDVIYHLAALSGHLSCDANPHSAKEINVLATRELCKLLSPKQVLIYASTTSLYGKSGGKMSENDTVPRQTSLYAKTKYEAEKYVMERKNSVTFRFATLFGVSPRMRNDLMVNDFVYRAISERSLVLFDSGSVRTFLHVDDGIRAYLLALEKLNKMAGQIYNIGSNDLNFSKLELAKSIKKQVDFEIVNSSLEDIDKRNFVITYDKISKLGYKVERSLDFGIGELVKLYSFYKPYSHSRPI